MVTDEESAFHGTRRNLKSLNDKAPNKKCKHHRNHNSFEIFSESPLFLFNNWHRIIHFPAKPPCPVCLPSLRWAGDEINGLDGSVSMVSAWRHLPKKSAGRTCGTTSAENHY